MDIKIFSFLEIKPKERATLRYPIVVPVKGDIEVRLYVAKGDNELATTTMTVDKEPHFYDLQVTDYKVEYKAGEKDLTEAFNCTLHIKNNDARPLKAVLVSRVGTDDSVYGEFHQGHCATLTATPGEEGDIRLDLWSDLRRIKEQKDLHLVISIYYPTFPIVRLLDITVKPGTIATPSSTAISTVKAEVDDAEATYYDLQGRRVTNPTRGVYIVNGRKVVK